MHYTIPCIPQSLNKFAGRHNVWEYRKQKEEWKMLIGVYCRPKPKKPIKKAVVTLTYFFPTAVRHDPDNYAGKAALDGLTAAGIIEDDSFNHIELRLKQGGVDKQNPRTEIEIEEV
jgi:Holliday junction resolvase RusA-like endonuclease